MIYDCFTYFNEKELLYFRLKHLWDWVDKFVIVEADYTHRGQFKGFQLEEFLQTDLLSWAKDKIIYVKKNIQIPKDIDDFDLSLGYYLESPFWIIENQQRNAILDGLTQTTDDDIILIGDLDEFPNDIAMSELKFVSEQYPLFVFGMKSYCYYLDCEQNIWDNIISWRGTVVGKRKHLKLPQQWRNLRNLTPWQHCRGYHFSWIGKENIMAKFKATAHHENEKFADLEHINKCFQLDENGRFPDYQKREGYWAQFFDILTKDDYPEIMKKEYNKFPEFFFKNIK